MNPVTAGSTPPDYVTMMRLFQEEVREARKAAFYAERCMALVQPGTSLEELTLIAFAVVHANFSVWGAHYSAHRIASRIRIQSEVEMIWDHTISRQLVLLDAAKTVAESQKNRVFHLMEELSLDSFPDGGRRIAG